MSKRKEFMKISPKKTLKFTSEQNKFFSFSSASQNPLNYKEEKSSLMNLEQKTIYNSSVFYIRNRIFIFIRLCKLFQIIFYPKKLKRGLFHQCLKAK